MNDHKQQQDYMGGITEFIISEDGKRIWVNVDGFCVLRVKTSKVIIEDNREVEPDDKIPA